MIWKCNVLVNSALRMPWGISSWILDWKCWNCAIPADIFSGAKILLYFVICSFFLVFFVIIYFLSPLRSESTEFTEETEGTEWNIELWTLNIEHSFFASLWKRFLRRRAECWSKHGTWNMKHETWNWRSAILRPVGSEWPLVEREASEEGNWGCRAIIVGEGR